MPYFYVPVPRGFDDTELDAFMDALNVSSRVFQTNAPSDSRMLSRKAQEATTSSMLKP